MVYWGPLWYNLRRPPLAHGRCRRRSSVVGVLGGVFLEFPRRNWYTNIWYYLGRPIKNHPKFQVVHLSVKEKMLIIMRIIQWLIWVSRYQSRRSLKHYSVTLFCSQGTNQSDFSMGKLVLSLNLENQSEMSRQSIALTEHWNLTTFSTAEWYNCLTIHRGPSCRNEKLMISAK